MNAKDYIADNKVLVDSAEKFVDAVIAQYYVDSVDGKVQVANFVGLFTSSSYFNAFLLKIASRYTNALEDLYYEFGSLAQQEIFNISLDAILKSLSKNALIKKTFATRIKYITEGV